MVHKKRFACGFTLLAFSILGVSLVVGFFDSNLPVAAAGNEELHGLPEIMRIYRSSGTPWTVIIDPFGKVVFNTQRR